ncbi:MAG TPA: carboxypeptidase-like regulatory domain-containing protein, partial [Planctomycetaceae bacterium]|nr:carboxypeptidase-like regulatory domain-containing protein [Planctomycetaceae bacterium]
MTTQRVFSAAPWEKKVGYRRAMFLLVCLVVIRSNVSGQTKDAAKSAPQNTPATGQPAKQKQDALGLPISIRGTVVDENGAPVSNAQIEEIGRSWHHEHLSARSDAAGNFTLTSRIPNFSRELIVRDDAGGRLGSIRCVFVEGAEPLRIVLRKPREIV